MTYFVAHGGHTRELMDKVNKHIRAGWEPIGGVAVSVCKAIDSGQYTTLYQAMVKRESLNPSISRIDIQPRETVYVVGDNGWEEIEP